MSAGANETENIRNGLERMKKTCEENAPAGLTWYSDYTPMQRIRITPAFQQLPESEDGANI